MLPVALFALSIPIACTIDSQSARIAADAPDRATFTEPGKILASRCGSLDCHGDSYRNYRLYGYGSARLDASHRPDAPDTTKDELTEDYKATVGVEPERIRDVASGKQGTESLTLMRKARGIERHRGGRRIVPGSDADRCLEGWLTGAMDDEACKTAMDEIVAARRGL